jgi:hypothetical protein
LIQWEWLGQDNQLFLLVPQTEGLQATTDGYLEIRAKHSGLVLDVAGAATKNGAPIIQWSTNRRRNQQWIP